MVRYRTVIKRNKSGRVVSVKSYTKSKSGKWTAAKANVSPAGATASRAKRSGGGVSVSKSGQTTYIPPEQLPKEPTPTPTPAQPKREPPKVKITYKSTGETKLVDLPETSRGVVYESMKRAEEIREQQRQQKSTQQFLSSSKTAGEFQSLLKKRGVDPLSPEAYLVATETGITTKETERSLMETALGAEIKEPVTTEPGRVETFFAKYEKKKQDVGEYVFSTKAGRLLFPKEVALMEKQKETKGKIVTGIKDISKEYTESVFAGAEYTRASREAKQSFAAIEKQLSSQFKKDEEGKYLVPKELMGSVEKQISGAEKLQTKAELKYDIAFKESADVKKYNKELSETLAKQTAEYKEIQETPFGLQKLTYPLKPYWEKGAKWYSEKVTTQKVLGMASPITSSLLVAPEFIKQPKVDAFLQSATYSGLTYPIEKPGRTVLFLGAGLIAKGVGTGAKIAGGVTSIKVATASTKAAQVMLYGGKSITYATKAGLAGVYGLEKSAQLYKAETPEEYGKIAGETVFELGAIYTGTKLATKIKVPGEVYYEVKIKPQLQTITRPKLFSTQAATRQEMAIAKKAGEVGYKLYKQGKQIQPQRDIPFEEVRGLGKKYAEAEAQLAKQGDIYGGSTTTRTFGTKPLQKLWYEPGSKMARVSKDIDVFLAKGGPGLTPRQPYAKLVDAHTYYERSIYPGARKPAVTPSGEKMVGFSEAAARKISGAFTVRDSLFYRQSKDVTDILQHIRIGQESGIKGLGPYYKFLETGYTQVSTKPYGKVETALGFTGTKVDLSIMPSAIKPYAYTPPVTPSVTYAGGLTPYTTASYSYTPPSFSPSLISSISPSASPSISPSVSPSYSPSISPSVSPSVSPSISPSVYPSISPSLSVSPSPSPYLYPSPSPSISPYPSPSPSPSPYISTVPWTPGPSTLIFWGGSRKRRKPKLKQLFKKAARQYKYQPSVTAIIRGVTGPKPKTITGFGIRPITKKFKLRF